MQLPRSLCAFLGHQWGVWTPTPEAHLVELMACTRCPACRQRRRGLR
jgi:hypothetical protein